MKTEQEVRAEIVRLTDEYKNTGGYTKEPVSAKVEALQWVLGPSPLPTYRALLEIAQQMDDEDLDRPINIRDLEN